MIQCDTWFIRMVHFVDAISYTYVYRCSNRFQINDCCSFKTLLKWNNDFLYTSTTVFFINETMRHPTNSPAIILIFPKTYFLTGTNKKGKMLQLNNAVAALGRCTSGEDGSSSSRSLLVILLDVWTWYCTWIWLSL